MEKHGDTHLGVDWPKKDDALKRYEVMLGVISYNSIERSTTNKIELLDFGCGASHLYEYIVQQELHNIEYNGLDLSEKFIALSRRKFPLITYYCLDILDTKASIPDFDYIVMNGVFNEKCNLSFDEMFSYFKNMVKKVFNKAKKGIAFNVMSKHVDWERDDLFHLSFDLLAEFLIESLTRKFVFRNDYGLYEYTTYIYK